MDALILVVIVIALIFFEGNIIIISALCGGDVVDFTEYWIIALLAVVLDFILLRVAMKIIIPPVSSSFQLMKDGLENRRIVKKESAKLKKLLKNEELNVNRLQELRDKRISESAPRRTLHFCQLIETIAGKGQLQDCISEVRERQNVLDEINDIENRILKIAESCKNVGDIDKCRYYLDILKSQKITREITSLEDECVDQLLQRQRESDAIRLWRKVFLWILAILIAAFVLYYFRDIL